MSNFTAGGEAATIDNTERKANPFIEDQLNKKTGDMKKCPSFGTGNSKTKEARLRSEMKHNYRKLLPNKKGEVGSKL